MPKTGYKATNAYGSRSIFEGKTYVAAGRARPAARADRPARTRLTPPPARPAAPRRTTGDFQSRVRKVGDENSKSLMPYHPNASRNRPEKTLQNTVGKRFVSWRNQSQVVIKDGDPDSVRPQRTTNQVYNAGLTEVIGLSNQGISAEIAKTLHAKQRR